MQDAFKITGLGWLGRQLPAGHEQSGGAGDGRRDN